MGFLRRDFAATDEQLVEAAERAEAGLRLAFPLLMETLAQPEDLSQRGAPKANPELADGVLEELARSRPTLIKAKGLADRIGDREAHLAISDLVERLDGLGDLLRQRWGSQ